MNCHHILVSIFVSVPVDFRLRTDAVSELLTPILCSK